MKPWLEDLSEEWVPQDTIAKPTEHTPQAALPKPKSRIPRMRHTSSSFSEIHVRRPVLSDARPNRPKSVLADRSDNDANLPSPAARNAPSAASSYSAGSQGSVVYHGTVAQKPVARSSIDNQYHATPEWRRRLVKGEVGYGEQKDLFSPMGLENIFQRPRENITQDSKTRESKLDLLKGLDTSAMPSSPPPWPPRGPSNRRQRDDSNPVEGDMSAMSEHPDGTGADDPGSSAYRSSVNLTKAGTQQDGPRTVSGQIEYENEAFSPVYLTTNLMVGHATKAATALSASTLANRLRQIGTPPPTFEHHPASESDSAMQNTTQNESSLFKLQDDTLPADLPSGTPDIGGKSAPFVEVKRGGYSQDNSFRRRPLSPSYEIQPSEDKVGSSKSANAAKGRARGSGLQQPPEPNARPVTPHQDSQFLTPGRAQVSGSPLKLFDAHDTFTSNRLQRRLSQLERKPEKAELGPYNVDSPQVQKTSRLPSVEEANIYKLGMESASEVVATQRDTRPKRVSTFGQGQLDQYAFPEDFSMMSSQASYDQGSAPEDSPLTDVAPPGSRQPTRFHSDGSPRATSSSRTKRQGLTRVSNTSRRASRVELLPPLTLQPEATDNHEYAEGKRGPTSPFKNPKRKRRRTLYSVDNEGSGLLGGSELSSTHEPQVAVHLAVGQTPPEAPAGRSAEALGPEAHNQDSRPRNPTPNHRMREEIQAGVLEATEAFIMSSPRMETIRERLQSPLSAGAPSEEAKAALVANEIAMFNQQRPPLLRKQSRKRSVTTQDFLNEAVKIMDYIRAKGRPTSGLESLEEFVSEVPSQHDDEAVGSSQLSFSRPPSREGRTSEWRQPNELNTNPKLMSHLRKYQEKESDDFMGSSVRSLHLARGDALSTSDGQSIVVEQGNIRITDNQGRQRDDLAQAANTIEAQLMMNGTHPSVVSSMGQTVATNASRRSENVANLAPEAVAHLIPEHVGGMSFDREKNIWVRQKLPSKEYHDGNATNVDESEDDPLGNIPDLTVDETAEFRMQNHASPVRPQATAETFLEDTEEAINANQSRPVTSEGKGVAQTDTSSVPSKGSNHFGWSFTKTDTRATSWSDQEQRKGSNQNRNPRTTTFPIPESDENDVEHEIKYYEGRDKAATPLINRRIRDITFSVEHQGGLDTRREESSQWAYPNAHTRHRPEQGPWPHKKVTRSMPASRAVTRPGDGDESIVNDLAPRNYRMQLSMSVSAPVLGLHKPDALVTVPSSPTRADVTFMLSDLPEFTLHQVDECEVPDRVVIKKNEDHLSKSIEDRYALGTADLIKALQDAAPDEPFWEDLRQVELRDKSLENLHRLDEFCNRLEELDVSNNNINQVKGIPYTVRRLRAANNALSGLTSWGTLMNLQHLDISGNDIDRLDGLGDLVHLRTLKVDNNRIMSLDGLMHLDGLMELSAAGNQVEAIDFSKANMKSLTDLNLSANRLVEVRNVSRLPHLQSLNLDNNRIDEFPLAEGPQLQCALLKCLRVCGNGMDKLDLVGWCPNLEALHVDGNSLTHVIGLERLKRLRTFSAREQFLEGGSDMQAYVENFLHNADVRDLHISINTARFLDVSQHLLNLQKLELASMGLEDLPDDFGQLTPNLRTLNLNFNSLKDLRPLLNIKRLNELFVAGNKLTRLRTNLAVIGKLTTLVKLDLRDNPLTLRFYPPASEKRVMSLRQKPSVDTNENRFVLPDGDAEEDKRYLQRLDFETRLRRRVQEIMLCTQCYNLVELDGLPFDKTRILVKDDIWDRLVFLGVIRRAEIGSQITNDYE
ncbi:hypothetical protein M011DRAFT_451924 [Sporormia fimetaria CBS 119925]|uniref:L domain-like protein n=1 Tax=Sporormia fimetaria CBS 119925 TaxID=1340428 RepID=A0A6A6UZF5_9PLEO|nr:hypothetical protein M011DRAFT_451924 [Sporormia fimetaria CBS 119925]